MPCGWNLAAIGIVTFLLDRAAITQHSNYFSLLPSDRVPNEITRVAGACRINAVTSVITKYAYRGLGIKKAYLAALFTF